MKLNFEIDFWNWFWNLIFLSISNLIFIACVACKNPIQNRQKKTSLKSNFKKQVRKLEISKTKCRSTKGKSGETMASLHPWFWRTWSHTALKTWWGQLVFKLKIKGCQFFTASKMCEWLNPIPNWCCHVILIYGLIPPSAGRNKACRILSLMFGIS